jgi:hypothetical protein
LAGFSSGYKWAKAIQCIRNGTAHCHHQNLAEVMAMGSAFQAFPITHPVHALFWTDPTSGSFLISTAIEELRISAAAAVA